MSLNEEKYTSKEPPPGFSRELCEAKKNFPRLSAGEVFENCFAVMLLDAT